MRRPLLAVVLATAASLTPLVPACSSNDAAPAGGADSSIPPDQLLGAPCNPLLANPCLSTNPCFRVTCDDTQTPATCKERALPGPCTTTLLDSSFVLDANVADAPFVSSGCQSSSQCKNGAVCAYSIFDACVATGVCVMPNPPVLIDGGTYTACGCNGQPVSFVTATQTSAPVASAAPCSADSGPASPDASDANAFDAADSAIFDASADASGD